MSVRTFNRDDSPIALRNTATVVIAATKFMKAISPGRTGRRRRRSSPRTSRRSSAEDVGASACTKIGIL